MPSIFFYISGHGFGHAARQVELINTLAPLVPSHTLAIRTSAPRWLFDSTLRIPVTWLAGPTDPGATQIDSLRIDESATIGNAAAFYRDLPAHVEREAALLRDHDARFVVADVPPVACAAAAVRSIPCAVVANFTWDWIYEGYAEELVQAPDLIPAIRDAYAKTPEAWRLPMHGGFSTFDRVIDVPYISRHGTRDRRETRGILGLPDDRPLALSSFGGYGVPDLDYGRLDCLSRFGVVITGHTRPALLPAGAHFVDERAMYGAGIRYEDLVLAVDVVVSKPGFGIIAECLANRTALLYTSRGRFVEYDVMVDEMPRVLRCGFLDQASLREGRWLAALERVLTLPSPLETPATNGAEVVAGMIRDRL